VPNRATINKLLLERIDIATDKAIDKATTKTINKANTNVLD